MSQAAVIDSYTLVLNKNWMAIGVTSVRHAISLIFTGNARVVHPETYEVHDFDSWADISKAETEMIIRSVSMQIRLPEIVVLCSYSGIPTRKVVFSRRNIFRRDGFTCQYCGTKPGPSSLTIDHVIPRSKGGRSTWRNCVLACLRCNTKKGNRSLPDSGMRLLKKPDEPHWVPYFSIPVNHRRVSWEKFISDSYWDVQLEE